MYHRRIDIPTRDRTVAGILGDPEADASVTVSPENLHDRLTGGAPFGHPAWDRALEAFDEQ